MFLDPVTGNGLGPLERHTERTRPDTGGQYAEGATNPEEHGVKTVLAKAVVDE